MNHIDTHEPATGGRLQMPRSRGAASGLLLVLLGLWGAAAPFLGPQLGFGYNDSQAWTAARGLLEVLPGVVAAVGGGLLLLSRNRATAMLGSWLAVLAGAWFVAGRDVAAAFGLGDVGAPVAATDAQRLWLELSYFHGLGAVVVFLGALALGRVTMRTARDVERARRAVVAPPVEDEQPTTALHRAPAESTT